MLFIVSNLGSKVSKVRKLFTDQFTYIFLGLREKLGGMRWGKVLRYRCSISAGVEEAEGSWKEEKDFEIGLVISV